MSGMSPAELWRAASNLSVERGECRLAEGKPIASNLNVMSKHLILTAVHWSKTRSSNSRHDRIAANAALPAVKRNVSEGYVNASGHI